MCPKCKTLVHCGNKCCRDKADGPYWIHLDGLIVYSCCGFAIPEMEDESLEYYGSIISGAWPRNEHTPSVEIAQAKYNEIYSKYVNADVSQLAEELH